MTLYIAYIILKSLGKSNTLHNIKHNIFTHMMMGCCFGESQHGRNEAANNKCIIPTSQLLLCYHWSSLLESVKHISCTVGQTWDNIHMGPGSECRLWRYRPVLGLCDCSLHCTYVVMALLGYIYGLRKSLRAYSPIHNVMGIVLCLNMHTMKYDDTPNPTF